MLFAQRSQMVSACYLNISGARIERVQGCSLTSLCLPSAASDSQKKKPGNNYSVSPGLGIYVREKHLIQTASFFCVCEEDVKLTRRQQREIIFISFCATAASRKRPDSVKTVKLDRQFEFLSKYKTRSNTLEKTPNILNLKMPHLAIKVNVFLN